MLNELMLVRLQRFESRAQVARAAGLRSERLADLELGTTSVPIRPAEAAGLARHFGCKPELIKLLATLPVPQRIVESAA